MTDLTYWVVWCPNKNIPSYSHPSYEAALAEAGKLAAKEKHYPFVVLKAVAVVRPTLPPLETVVLRERDDIPEGGDA
jgi:hypothetical protein